MGVTALGKTVWHSKLRFELEYPNAQIRIAFHPIDCRFLTAPLGTKGCYYQMSVGLVAKTDKGTAIYSEDGGEHWNDEGGDPVDEGDAVVKGVNIEWVKTQ